MSVNSCDYCRAIFAFLQVTAMNYSTLTALHILTDVYRAVCVFSRSVDIP